VSATENPHAPGTPSGSFVVFAKERSEMQLSIVAMPRGQGSTLVANVVTKDTGTGAY
jgi:formylmethanofuran dehydrogenase subunit D